MFLIATAFAHGPHHQINNPFLLKWIWDPTLVFFLILAFLYARGIRKRKPNSGIRHWQVLLFFTGIGVLTFAYLPPIDTLSDQLFSIHMIQHLLITSIGVPLIVLGAPFIVILGGVPTSLELLQG
jgi:putative membrane protein